MNCCIAKGHLLNTFRCENVRPLSDRQKYAINYSPKVLRAKQYGKTDYVFMRLRNDDVIGRYLFSTKNSSGILKCFFELVLRTPHNNLWKCSELIKSCDIGKVQDVVSLIHHCREHGCLDKVLRNRQSSASSATSRASTESQVRRRRSPKPSTELMLVIKSCGNRFHRASGPYYIGNFY